MPRPVAPASPAASPVPGDPRPLVDATREWLASLVAGTGLSLPFVKRTALVVAGLVRADTAIPHQVARAAHALLPGGPGTGCPLVASVDRRVARALADPRLDPMPFLRQVSPRAVCLLVASVTLAHEAHARACGLPGALPDPGHPDPGHPDPGHPGDGPDPGHPATRTPATRATAGATAMPMTVPTGGGVASSSSLTRAPSTPMRMPSSRASPGKGSSSPSPCARGHRTPACPRASGVAPSPASGSMSTMPTMPSPRRCGPT